ncbi:MAG TPA: M50 family metallopeptidase [Candidatus Limnocylindrales bacterium]|jgi:regulator of sigma E protease|nr:M50 family metallopeptidase [Candidatus Limnocylindrales bacterium]
MPIIDPLINIALLLLILVVLVVVHEFGHFVAARRANVRVHEFGIGFPPRAAVLARDHETIYSLNWLPLGGFVRLEGEEGVSRDPRAFVNQPLWKRLIILLAGVAMNFLLAWLIFSIIAGAADPTTAVRIAAVQDGSPADQAGLVGGRPTQKTPEGVQLYDDSGDLILAIDGVRFPSFDDLRAADAPLRYLREHAGQTVTLTVQHANGSVEDVQATLRPAPEINERQGALGIQVGAFEPGDYLRRDPASAIVTGIDRTVDASLLVLVELRNLVANLTAPNVAGPIGIVGAVAIARTELPPIFLLWLVGLLSANLAVINVLPLPPMDGGRIAVNVVQAVTGNRISTALERAVYLAGFVFLIIFLVWISYFDIQRLAEGG